MHATPAFHVRRTAPPKLARHLITGKRPALPCRFVAGRHHIQMTGKAQMRMSLADTRIKIGDIRRAVVRKSQTMTAKTGSGQNAFGQIERLLRIRRDTGAANQLLRKPDWSG